MSFSIRMGERVRERIHNLIAIQQALFILRCVSLPVCLTVMILPNWANAQVSEASPAIFDVRRSLPLEPTEPSYHDFYINAGPESGFRKGSYASVVRQISVHDPIQNKQQATMNVIVGYLKIIHVEKNLTIGRLHAQLGNEDRPTLEFEAVMIGDRIDVASISSQPPGTKKAAELDPASSPAVEQVVPAISVQSTRGVSEKEVPIDDRSPVVTEEKTSETDEPSLSETPPSKKTFPTSTHTDIVRLFRELEEFEEF
jgi:hypothetical protein